ncbi:MAG TPA: DUF448 domain-containing protein [Clostridiales bacterium]|nr:DUF448 domain-containing protein [Clostridiales bacterium]
MIKKIPMRTCIACKECKPKKELIRIVKTDEGFKFDKTGKLNGRGAYICNDSKCRELLFKNKLLNKTFKCNVSSDEYNSLKDSYESK